MIQLFQGSILDVEADVIVNPANSFLNHGGGLAAIIARAAAPSAPTGADSTRDTERDAALWQQDHDWLNEQANAPLVATGNAVATSAGRLPYKGIVHAVGPIWNGGQFKERCLLASAHREACAVAHDLGARSVAFPAISCGIFGFPVDKAAVIAVEALSEFWAAEQPDGIGMTVTFALFEDEHLAAYERAIGSRV